MQRDRNHRNVDRICEQSSFPFACRCDEADIPRFIDCPRNGPLLLVYNLDREAKEKEPSVITRHHIYSDKSYENGSLYKKYKIHKTACIHDSSCDYASCFFYGQK